MTVPPPALAQARLHQRMAIRTLPTVSGTPMVGRTLVANKGRWTHRATVSFGWQRCNAEGKACANVTGARRRTYLVSSASAGRTIRVRVTGRSRWGSGRVLSGATALVRDPTSLARAHRPPTPPLPVAPTRPTPPTSPTPPTPPTGTASCDRYASPSGSDGGQGTQTSPYHSVQKLSDSLTAGQTGCLRQGTYGSATTWTQLNTSGTSGHSITYVSYPGERATLQGSTFVNGDDITLSHLTFDENYLRPRVNHPGCDPQGALALDIFSSNVTLEYSDVHQQDVPAAQRDTAIGVWSTHSGARTSNVVLRHNKIHDYGACSAYDHGIYFDHTANGQIYGNWIYNGACSYGQGDGDHSRGCGAGIQLYVDPIGTEVHGNVIDGQGLGFYISGSGGKVYNNVVTNTRGYYQSGPSLIGPVVLSGWGGVNNQFNDNATFNSGGLCDDCTGITNPTGNVTADPQFTDVANHDYSLRSSSPIPASWGIWNGQD